MRVLRVVGPALASGCLLLGCGGDDREAEAPVHRETPADEILRIGNHWVSRQENRGLLSPPSAISVFVVREESTVTLAPKSAKEELVVEEQFELRSGATIHCRTEFSHDLTLQWGRRGGTAAVQLVRPALDAPRVCDGPGHPEPRLSRGRTAARFILSSDALEAVDPPLEKRRYLPLP